MAGKDAQLQEADFADMHLVTGETLVAQAETVIESEHFTVSYIGAHGHLSFLTSLPVQGDKGMWITPGSRFLFRVVHGVYAYAFSARALRAHSRPYPYAHFSMPESVKYRQIRQSHRLETRLPAEITRANGGRSLAILRDISLHGAKLELSGVLDEIGARLSLSVPIILPGQASAILLDAVIRNSMDLDRSIAVGRFLYGVQFVDPSAESISLLERFIEHLLVERLA